MAKCQRHLEGDWRTAEDRRKASEGTRMTVLGHISDPGVEEAGRQYLRHSATLGFAVCRSCVTM